MAFEAGNQFGALTGPTNSRRRLVTQQLISVLHEVDDKGVSRLRRMASKLVDLALDGDVMAIREISDRIEGKPVQMISGDPDGSPLVVEIVKLAQLGAARVIEHEDTAPGSTMVGLGDCPGNRGDGGAQIAADEAVNPTAAAAQPVEVITGSDHKEE